MADQYLDVITSQHRLQPKYIAMVEAYLRKLQEAQNVLDGWNVNFTLDDAVGAQLDSLGAIVGRSRVLDFQPTGYSARLDDETYRLVIKAKILQNNWDGTIKGIQDLFDIMFPGKLLVLQDAQYMTMRAAIVKLDDDLLVQLVDHGYILPKPAGVRLNAGVIQDKVFAYDLNNESFGGYDGGEWL